MTGRRDSPPGGGARPRVGPAPHRPPAGPGPWFRGLARLTCGATLLLIVAGGLVTTTGAGLAVPDWPTTFGHPMFLFPWAGMVGGVLVEHSHRLLGAVVGLLTVALAVVAWAGPAANILRVLTALAVALVGVQGLLGGLRVVLLRDDLALVHGSLAPLFFALTAALVGLAAPGPSAPGAERRSTEPPGLRRVAVAAAGVLYGQIVLGVLTTHRGWVLPHLAGAVLATVAVLVLARRAFGASEGGDPLRARARVLRALLALQVGLGFGAYVVRFTGHAIPGGELTVIGLPVAHRAAGALLFALAVSLAVPSPWWRPPAGDRRQSVPFPGPEVSARVTA